MTTAKQYSPAFRPRAVQMVGEHRSEYSFKWATMGSIAERLSCKTETLHQWLQRAHGDNKGVGGDLFGDERERLKALERENRKLGRANEILRKASAFLPRRGSTATRSDARVHHSRRRESIVRERAS